MIRELVALFICAAARQLIDENERDRIRSGFGTTLHARLKALHPDWCSFAIRDEAKGFYQDALDVERAIIRGTY